MHKWHDVITAYLLGDTIQYRPQGMDKWITLTITPSQGLPYFDIPTNIYRVKPQTVKVKYKKVLTRIGGEYRVINLHSDEVIESFIKTPVFIRIVSDWITEEVEL